eukprot:739817_1
MAFIQFIHIVPLWIIVICVHIFILHQFHADTHSSPPTLVTRHLQQNDNDTQIPVRCRQSILEIWNKCCLNNLFSQYLDQIGFKYQYKTSAKAHIIPNIKLIKIANINNASNALCYGLQIQSNAASMVKSQADTNKYIDLTSLYHKSSLHSTVKQYALLNGIDHSFLPNTYRLDNRYERRDFFRTLPCADDHNHLWIFKTNAHGGSGIHLIDNPMTMRRLFWRDQDIEYAMRYVTEFEYDCNNEYISRFDAHNITQFGFNVFTISRDNINTAYAVRQGVIAQEFIANPLLIHNRKFHIRVFVMIASLNPYIVLYGNGFVILAAHEYDANNINKQNAITNRAVSRQTQDGEDIEWSWSFEQLDQYLKTHQMGSINVEDIQKQMKRVVNITFLSAIKNKKDVRTMNVLLKEHSRTYQHAFFALDLLLTNQGEIKLLEVQNAPKTTVIPAHCNTADTHWACQLGQRIAKETVDIAIEMAYRKVQKRSISPQRISDLTNHYQMILYKELAKETEHVDRYLSSDDTEFYHEFGVGEF